MQGIAPSNPSNSPYPSLSEPSSGQNSSGQYQNYTDKNTDRLAIQNSANIDYLKSRVDNDSKITNNLNQQVTDLSLNVIRLNQQVAGLVAQQTTMASNFNNSSSS